MCQGLIRIDRFYIEEEEDEEEEEEEEERLFNKNTCMNIV